MNTWYVKVKSKGITFYIKTDNLEYLIAATDEMECDFIHANKEVDDESRYTDIDEVIPRRLRRR